MRIVRMRTLGMLGIGFLAGSRAGRGPWDKAQASMDQIKDKVGGTTGSATNGATASNGFNGGTRSQTNPQMTEI